MKNIFYLLRSQRLDKGVPNCYFGLTNYLHRQLLIHNHRWHPRIKARQRLPPPQPSGQWRWEPMMVVTGFSSESHAHHFLAAFNTPSSQPYSQPPSKCPSNPVTYRCEQALRILSTDGMLDQLGGYVMVHWASEKDRMDVMERVKDVVIPGSVVQQSPLDIGAIDMECFDETDEEDDRNYEMVAAEKRELRRVAEVQRVAAECGLDLDETEKVLRESREAMLKEAGRGKHGRKTRAYLTPTMSNVLEANQLKADQL